ncbi:ferritin family protein [Halonatronum saccharophilum]|uniref:ferritin family protein n=1 Tax=Halonatronum saccharophilum TaxID=150060 RepID=UPI000483442B|nr:ferritin family protein [Halonatronum saccharophilum]
MEDKFNISEILQIAMNTEKEGELFYKKCANIHTNSKIKEVFLELAEDERDHYSYFNNLLKQFKGEYKAFNNKYLQDREVNSYLKTLVHINIFPDDTQNIEKVASNLKEAIDIGVRAEQNSLLLYSELLRFQESKGSIDALEKLIIEERRHLIKLESLKSHI